VVHQLVRVPEAGGENAAAELAAKLGKEAEVARELAYRLYTVCERKKRAPQALLYNALVKSWPENTRLAHLSQRQYGDRNSASYPAQASTLGEYRARHKNVARAQRHRSRLEPRRGAPPAYRLPC
jgi:hypothetical protein